jgi:hypothetical protein
MNLPKSAITQLMGYISEQLETSTEVEYLICWLKPMMLYHNDTLSSKELEIISNLKNAMKSLKRRVDTVVEM